MPSDCLACDHKPQHCTHRYLPGTRRWRTPESTLAVLEPFVRSGRISRLAEVTGLDVLGIPVWQAIRPLSRNLCVSQGKGLTDESAKVGAIMEAVEMSAAETPPMHELAAPNEITAELNYDLRELPGCVHRNFDPSLPIEWTAAWVLQYGLRTFVPRDLVNLDFTRKRLELPPYIPTSTGLASGNCLAEAVLHGLYEVVERDTAFHSHISMPAVVNWEETELSEAIDRIHGAELTIDTQRLYGRLPVPCFRVTIASKSGVSAYGTAARLDPRAALIAAFLEAAQSRLTIITGARDDIRSSDYELTLEGSNPEEGREEPVTMERVPCQFQTPGSELEALLGLMSSFAPIVVPFQQATAAYAVMFVVVPGLRGPLD